MKTVKMLIDQRGSQDGITIEEFNKGEVYTISDRLAEIFIDSKIAKEYEEKIVSEYEDKVVHDKKKK